MTDQAFGICRYGGERHLLRGGHRLCSLPRRQAGDCHHGQADPHAGDHLHGDRVSPLCSLNLKRKEAMALQQDGSALKAEFSIGRSSPGSFWVCRPCPSWRASFLSPAQLVSGTKTASKFPDGLQSAAIGLNTSFASMKKAGIRPMIHGFIISVLVVNCGALLVEMGMGIV